MLTASQIMTKQFLTILPEMSVEELARLLLREDVTGAVVIDKKGKLLGVVTEGDLIAKEKNLHLPTVVSLFDSAIYLGTSEHFKDELHKMVATKVDDIFTKAPVTIDLNTFLADIATIMSEKRIHFLPVMHEGRVEGVVGRREILRALAEGS
ncbi:MAG: CBS domain-containing protein [bacterium]|nr:CBS domain-containing protein [bacterium]MDT8366176.1 CBS domain-containing protein [bacterium]